MGIAGRGNDCRVQRHRSAGDTRGRSHGGPARRARAGFRRRPRSRRSTTSAGVHCRRARARRRDVGERCQRRRRCSSRADQRFSGLVRAPMARRTLRRRDAAHPRRVRPDVALRVIAAPSESERGRDIARRGDGVYVDTPSIRDAFALVATADFVFTPDTSIAHAASAFQKPSVAIFVRGKAERWGCTERPARTSSILNDTRHTRGRSGAGCDRSRDLRPRVIPSDASDLGIERWNCLAPRRL